MPRQGQGKEADPPRWPAHLAEVPGMVLVHHDAVVVLTTSVTATARMLPMLADAAMTGTDVAPLLPVLLQVCTARDGVGGGSVGGAGTAKEGGDTLPGRLRKLSRY